MSRLATRTSGNTSDKVDVSKLGKFKRVSNLKIYLDKIPLNIEGFLHSVLNASIWQR
jgi:hypothetical protein